MTMGEYIKEWHKVYETLSNMGATKEDTIKIIEITYTTADKIIREGE